MRGVRVRFDLLLKQVDLLFGDFSCSFCLFDGAVKCVLESLTIVGHLTNNVIVELLLGV